MARTAQYRLLTIEPFEQDTAAGGLHKRRVLMAPDVYALASVFLRVPPRARRIYAYLRWSQGGTTIERYIGEVSAQSRPDNLQQAWEIALRKESPAAAGAPNKEATA